MEVSCIVGGRGCREKLLEKPEIKI